ncbi:ABA4-like family protein [Ferruginibacter sp. SUN106]|uniref:ABA4-like family protein n=1 Tax=Ferruginibacter sp. SUN106 TaxID=2978348 RepID=UPI003D364580
MIPDTIFKLCNTIALLAWVILIFATPFWKHTHKFLVGIVITLFCLVYSWLICTNFHAADFQKFSTLDGVVSLFADKTVVVGGWVHYLAFDLMTGIWITSNAKQYGINHWLITPALFFTFMLGPVGLLLYLLIRFAKTKNYFAANYN